MLDKDELKTTLLRAGLTPRDLTGILTCHPITLYQYLTTGRCRELTEFQFEKIKRFLDTGVEANVFPMERKSNAGERQSAVKQAYTQWVFQKESFNGSDSK